MTDRIQVDLLWIMVSIINLQLAPRPSIKTIFAIITIIFTLFFFVDVIVILANSKQRKRGFEYVVDEHKKTHNKTKLPFRSTRSSMAYDFYANEDYIVKPNEIVKIWTDVKAYMQDNECLILNVRSSMGGKFMLANTQGWIDSDYYSNESNDGNIGIFLKNISNETLAIKSGDKIAQGAFFEYLVADMGNSNKTRKGGFGSTDETK